MHVGRSGIVSKILGVTIFSAAIAFSPALLFRFGSEAGTTGAGGYVVLFFCSIPAGLAVFAIGVVSSIRSYWNSLSDSEKEQLVLELRRRGPWLILLAFLTYAILEVFDPL
ncbi:MAG: hypothetical protein CMA00_004430 [Methanobacteriota archaeon]|nr:MAG: hypothetical protein CMA00_004430 [Euryarchaeota archaeon]|tara:strand:- start:673 stop:1005 length:333 start_codon:yes stop_codon:yes gene_type:complete